MINLPKTVSRKENFLSSTQEQINSLKEKLQNLLRENDKISQKIQNLQFQQGRYKKRYQEISLLIENFEFELAEVKNLEFQNKKSNSPKSLEENLQEYGLTLQDYEEGLVPPSVCAKLNISSKS